MKKKIIWLIALVLLGIALFLPVITISTPKACFVPPCPQEMKLPLVPYLLHRIFPNNFLS